jgi:xanthine dehydrogenase YagR molybdenum-binding subunit
MDELAYRVGLDPVELRRRNHTDRWPGPLDGRPWSGKQLLECYDLGAQAFGWDRRPPRPRAMRDGADWVGYGMASAIRMENRGPAVAEVSVYPDGTADVRATTSEIGTGNLTTLTQVAASGVGIPVGRVRIESGHTDLPPGTPTQGSRTSGNLGSAVHLAAELVRAAAIGMAVADPASPLYGRPASAVVAGDGRLFLRDEPRRGETYGSLLTRNRVDMLRREGRYDPPALGPYATATFGAQFTEVRVDADLPRVRVTRHVGVFAVGRILNHKTARNQAQGGIAFAIGGALTEALLTDPVSGRFVGAALTDYHVPVHADVGEIDVHFVEEPDYNAHPLGAKGLGEVVCIGVDAAIANAVFHATGVRVRDLPITPDKLLTRR